ncbi:MAG TPA: hypothetical protein VHE35_00070 [Kofleriaceae bacterium]|nr:hypothetical protein [Kofleriaceae bacterium]
MSRSKSWVIAIIGVAVVGLGALSIRELTKGSAAVPRDADRRAPAPDAAPAAPTEVAPSLPERVAPIRQSPGGEGRVMPYRPATYLSYSAGLPSRDPAQDDSSPILRRLLTVTEATADQEARIRRAWRTHEDGRRVLLAAAPPPSIGDPVLEPTALASLDRQFSDSVSEILTPRQYYRLSFEFAPPAPESDSPTPEP